MTYQLIQILYYFYDGYTIKNYVYFHFTIDALWI